MDERITLKKGATFFDQLKALMYSQKTASMLLDEKGLERAEGIVSEIILRPDGEFVVIGDNPKIRITDLVAVNGIFQEDYTSC